MLPFLLCIGLRRFSIDMVNAPALQRLVGAITLQEAEEIAGCMLELGRISQIEAFLLDRNMAPATMA